ncbi:hypothetical protein COO60DRAFT_1562551 [Scenedesmus sp. NREL 46B-D3]|nr:hypothetical protein COO60DRAFT_1562551 [Scenedesmus sp. NREL 46B-D3]
MQCNAMHCCAPGTSTLCYRATNGGAGACLLPEPLLVSMVSALWCCLAVSHSTYQAACKPHLAMHGLGLKVHGEQAVSQLFVCAHCHFPVAPHTPLYSTCQPCQHRVSAAAVLKCAPGSFACARDWSAITKVRVLEVVQHTVFIFSQTMSHLAQVYMCTV